MRMRAAASLVSSFSCGTIAAIRPPKRMSWGTAACIAGKRMMGSAEWGPRSSCGGRIAAKGTSSSSWSSFAAQNIRLGSAKACHPAAITKRGLCAQAASTSSSTESESEKGRDKGNDEDVGPIKSRDLFLAGFIPGLPWFAMGFIDNSIMLVAGSWIDQYLGVVIGLSALGAAAMGNAFSDVIGAGCASTVEDLVRRIGIPLPNLTKKQALSFKIRMCALLGSMIGVFFGCCTGNFPLLWIDQDKIAEDKRQAELQTTFEAVVEEVHSLMDCERASLWMVDSKAHEIYTKAGTGEITLRLPMGRGIIGMCINEGKLIRIDDVESHPAFMRSSKMRRMKQDREGAFRARSCITIPIFAQDNSTVLGAIQVMNKLGNTTKFDSADEENLRNISKVVQVAVQHCFAPPDTKKESIIQQLKQHTTCPTKHQATSKLAHDAQVKPIDSDHHTVQHEDQGKVAAADGKIKPFVDIQAY